MSAVPLSASARPQPHWLTPERVLAYSAMIVAIFGLGLIVWVALALPSLVDPRGKPLGYDFMAFWSAAQLALAGRAEAAFDGPTIAAIQHAVIASDPAQWFAWHYPPMFLLAVTPLGLLPYPAALIVFVSGTATLWAALARRMWSDKRVWLVVAATPAGLINLLDGQNAFLTAGLAGFALVWLDRRPIAAGVMIGLLSVKPHLAVLFPIALLAQGRWTTIVAAAVTALALTAASLAVFGWGALAGFLAHLSVTRSMVETGALPWGTMPSAYVFALSLGVPALIASTVQALVAVAAAICVWLVWRRRDAPFEAQAATLLAASLLALPYLFYYDLLWAALAVGFLAIIGLRSGFRHGEREVLLAAWLVPVVMVPVHAISHVQLGFPVLAMLLVAAVRRALSDSAV